MEENKYWNIKNEEKEKKINQLLNHPLKLIKEGGKLGIKGSRKFLTIIFLFAATNTLLFFFSISRLFIIEFAFDKLLFTLLILIIGIAITIFAGYKAYQYMVIDAIRVLYKNLSPIFIKLSESIIGKVESLFQGKNDINNSQLTKTLNIGKIINSNYQKIPRFLRKGIIIILNRIPIVDMIIDLRQDILSGNKMEASIKLHSKIDRFILGSIFENNNTKWVWWMLPINMIAILVLIKIKIG